MFIDKYLLPDPKVPFYKYGVLHFLFVRFFALLIPAGVSGLICLKLYEGYLHSRPLVFGRAYYVLYILITAVTIPLFIARVKSVKYVVTDKKLLIEDKWISREGKARIYSKLSDVSIKQGLIGRLFGYGTVIPTMIDMEAFGLRVASGVAPVRVPLYPTLTNSLYQVDNPEQAWKTLLHLVQYRDISETFERVGGKLTEKLDKIEKKFGPY